MRPDFLSVTGVSCVMTALMVAFELGYRCFTLVGLLLLGVGLLL